jgi:hypothetical protein
MPRDGNWLYQMASAKEAMKTAIGISKSALPVVFRYYLRHSIHTDLFRP